MAASKPVSISFGSLKNNKNKVNGHAKSAKILPTTTEVLDQKKNFKTSALADQDSETEDVGHVIESVTGFDQSAGGAIGNKSSLASDAKKPLVIQAQKNRDWREESRRSRRSKNQHVVRDAARSKNDQIKQETEWNVERDILSTEAGLKLAIKKEEEEAVTLGEQPETVPIAAETGRPEVKKEETADDEAIAALMGEERKSTLTIAAVPQIENKDPEPFENLADEDDRYRADVAARPDCASLADYAAVPVEEFGAALLRGMGWKDGQVVGKNTILRDGPLTESSNVTKRRPVERRPALLGIGAKEMPSDAGFEMGAWGKSAKKSQKKDLLYNPVLLKDSRTGKLMTEDELHRQRDEDARQQKREDKRDRREERHYDYNKTESRSRHEKFRPSKIDADYDHDNARYRSGMKDSHRHRDHDRGHDREKSKHGKKELIGSSSERSHKRR